MSHSLQSETAPSTVDVTGDMTAETRQYVEDRIRSLTPYAHRPILHAHIVIETFTNTASSRQFQASAQLDVSGRHVNGKAVGDTLHEAVDTLRQRLHSQLDR
jgi:ribosome-associated translation inhibitor RaiA